MSLGRAFPRLPFATALVVPVVLVAFGAVLTTVYHVAACPLCIVQRMLFLCIALAASIGLAGYKSKGLGIAAGIAIAIIGMAGAAVAGYQIYLQQHPFVATCGDGTAWWEKLVDKSGQMLPVLFKADGLCSDATWTLLGFSIVEWSLAAFTMLALSGMLGLFARPWKGR